ncbi:MAG: alpha/beta hydrolase [Candidatus Eremiobacteraeota bacterium]|nr:alpha/beta hydrolase [Candidatus Eremiobacteraeota bacterium]
MTTCFPSLEHLLARDHPGVARDSRTIAYVHPQRRERAVVLLHGMSATPAQFERLARVLFERGYNVVVPRLPHHGHANRLSEALQRLRSEELYAAGRRYYEVARELGDYVTVAGFSLGGLLAAWVGQNYAVDRCVPISPFLGVWWIPNVLMGPIAERLLRVPNRFHWWNPFLRERQFLATNGYPRYATHAIAYSYRVARTLLDEARARPPLAAHMAIVTNSAEVAVNNYAIRRLYKSWRSARPGNVDLIMLRGFPLSHDIVSPLRGRGLAERAHPRLLDAIDPLRAAQCR